MSKTSAFKLNDLVSVVMKGRKITGKLIGIDSYSLESFDGKKCDWPSYTLVSDKKDTFSRYWFVRWGKSNWILWLQAKKMTVSAGAKIIPAKSGIAKIAFKGDTGVSTPFAALVQYKTDDGYFASERFAGSDVMHFTGHKIAKPRIEPGG